MPTNCFSIVRVLNKVHFSVPISTYAVTYPLINQYLTKYAQFTFQFLLAVSYQPFAVFAVYSASFSNSRLNM